MMRGRMTATRACTLLLSLTLSCALAFAEEGTKGSVPVPFSGLTNSIGEILRARPAASAVIDSLSFSFDRILDGALPRSFDCDAELGEYLNQEGPLYYEAFAEIIKQALYENIRAEGSGAVVLVSASEEDAGITYISIEIQSESAVLLPVYVETEDGKLSYSFAIPCDLVCALSVGIRVDSALAMNGGPGAGVFIDVERLSVRVSRPEAEVDGEGDAGIVGERLPAVALLGGDVLVASVPDAFVELSCEWTLRGESDGDEEFDEGKPRWIPYERIASGEYEWAMWAAQAIAYTIEADVDPDSDSGLVVARFEADEQSSSDGMFLSYTDDSGSERLRIRDAALTAR